MVKNLYIYIFLFHIYLIASFAETETKKNVSIDTNLLKPMFYPHRKGVGLRVGDEDYQSKYKTLQGLTGIYIDLEGVLKGAKARALVFGIDLEKEVKNLLKKHNLKLLTKEEVERTPGQPSMSIFPSFPEFLGPYKEGEKHIEFNNNCCVAGMWTSFTQGGRILRDPYTNYTFGTWGEGQNTNDCSNLKQWFPDAVLQTIEDFLSDKDKAEKDYVSFMIKKKSALKKTALLNKNLVEKKVVKEKVIVKVVSQPLECNTAMMMYIELFRTNSSDIIKSKYFVLDKLSEVINACPSYNYIIESHADQRASFEHNERLSMNRGKSISQYLYSKGVSSSRFEIQSFGEMRPVNMGTTDEDYAANRRVVVTPYKVKFK